MIRTILARGKGEFVDTLELRHLQILHVQLLLRKVDLGAGKVIETEVDARKGVERRVKAVCANCNLAG